MEELTVIVPAYNGARFLPPTLTSLQLQTKSVQAIVVDDGSTDGSAEVAVAHPLRPRVLRQRHSGVAVARNRGLAEASTQWIAFLDQDDLWHPERTATLLSLADRTGAAAVGTTAKAWAIREDKPALEAIGDGREHWPSRWIAHGSELELLLEMDVGGTGDVDMLTTERLMQAPASVSTAFMYDRVATISVGGCATFVRAADDHVLNVLIARFTGQIPLVDRPSLFYRVHPTSATTASPLATAYLTTLLALRYGGVLAAEPVSSAFVDHLLSQLHRTSLSPIEQAALLALTTKPLRARRVARWLWRLLAARRPRPADAQKGTGHMA